MLRDRAGLRSLLLIAGLSSMTAAGCKESTPAELSQPAKIVLVSGDNQSANGVALPLPLVVQVTDPRNQPVEGVTINWSTTDPGATLSAATSTTDADGRASINWTLGTTGGRQTVTATTPTITGAAVVFQANGGGVLSGGVTVQAAPPVAFSASLSRGASGGGLTPLSTARTLVQPALSAKHIEAVGRATRRLIVAFKPMAGAMRIATAGGVIQRNMTAMRSTLASHVSANRITRPEMSPAILTARVTVPAGVAIAEARAALLADPTVDAVTEDRIYPMLSPYAATPLQATGRGEAVKTAPGAFVGVLPNDPGLEPALWHYNLVDAPRAWKTSTGSKAVLVAVVDNGARFDHPAMGLGAASNYTSDGYNFVAEGDRLAAPEPVCAPAGPLGETTTLHENGPSADPTQPDDFDGFTGTCWVRSTLGNHGLHVAGTIGAVGNDGVGVTGLNWRVSIRPVRVLDITGSGSFFDIAQGVLYAAGLPAAAGTTTVQAPTAARIINMSLGGSANVTVLRDAVTAATNAGSLIVASAGNSESSTPSYPAAYPEVLATSAVGPDLSISSYTNVGGNVSLAAPGGNFRSTSDGTSGVLSSTWNFVTGAPSYAFYEGTSMSAPHVTGIAAMVLAVAPALTNAQLRARLQNTAVHVGAPGRNNEYGYGIANAYNAITNSSGPAHTIQVRAVNATTGATVQTVAATAAGGFTFTRLPAGSYFVYAGQDEDDDHKIGVPGRRFGWYGGPGGPTPITIGAGGNASASVSIGTPIESKPHTTIATANRLSINTYMVGQITATDGPGVYSVLVPSNGTYYFEAAHVLGSCNWGIELNTKLEVLDATGAVLATSDDAGPNSATNPLGVPGGSYCSVISGNLAAGTTYYLRVSGSTDTPTGQYRIWVRDAI